MQYFPAILSSQFTLELRGYPQGGEKERVSVPLAQSTVTGAPHDRVYTLLSTLLSIPMSPVLGFHT